MPRPSMRWCWLGATMGHDQLLLLVASPTGFALRHSPAGTLANMSSVTKTQGVLETRCRSTMRCAL
eukprot:9479003-Pyramimonas_sp.AAC.1